MKMPEKSTIYGIVYLALIPLFAFVYDNFLPEAFSQSAGSYEKDFAGDLQRIERELGDWLIQNQSSGVRWGSIKRVTNCSLESDTIEKVNSIRITFVVTSEAFEPGAATTVSVGEIMTASYPKHRKGSEAIVRISNSGFDPQNAARGWTEISLLDCDRDMCELEMPGHLADLLKSYDLAQEGIASQVSGNFGRMMFLSAVTATTVGYGDIVPITRESRLLVALEAVLEIVVIGLFLNALANRRGVPSSVVHASERDHPRRQRRPRRWTPGRPRSVRR